MSALTAGPAAGWPLTNGVLTPSSPHSVARLTPAFVTVQEHARQARATHGSQIIEGMGGAGDVVELFGDEGSAKSRLALGLAHALTCERAWGPFKINRNGKVLLLETDMPNAAQGAMAEEFATFGYFNAEELLTLPVDRPNTLYHVESNQRVRRLWVPTSGANEFVAVIVDTWSSLFSVQGDPANAYMEGVVRAVVGQLRNDYPKALLIVLNHTTGQVGEERRSLSPGLRRIATTRYKVVPPSSRDALGRWEKSGTLQADGKFSRSDKLPRRVTLRWDWAEKGDPAPHPTLDDLGPAEWVALFPDVPGLTGAYATRADALRDLARVSGQSFEGLKTAARRHKNPALDGLGGSDG